MKTLRRVGAHRVIWWKSEGVGVEGLWRSYGVGRTGLGNFQGGSRRAQQKEGVEV